MQVMSTQYFSSWPKNICSDFDLYSDKTFHEPIFKSLDRFVGRRVLDSPAVASLDFVTMLFPGAGFQPCVQPPSNPGGPIGLLLSLGLHHRPVWHGYSCYKLVYLLFISYWCGTSSVTL